MTASHKEDVANQLIKILNKLLAESPEMHHREIKLTASFSRHLNLDSLARAEYFRRIEAELKVSLPDHLLRSADSINDILIYFDKVIIPLAVNREDFISHQTFSLSRPKATETLLDVLQHDAKVAPDKAQIYFYHETGQKEIITYNQLLQASLRVAQGLQQLGLNAGETVAIMQPTHPDFFYAFFGVLFAGGIPVPIYPPFRLHMLEAYAKLESHILRNAEVRVLITFERVERLGQLLKSFVPSLKQVVTTTELLENEPLSSPFKPHLEDAAFIQYTSGSTNMPKGVLLNHANLMANINAYGERVKITAEDVLVSWLPLYHDMGLIGMGLGSLYYGIPLILMTPFSFLNHPEKWLWTIHYHRATLSGAPNFAYDLCVRKIDTALLEGLDLSSWRIAANGAEKVYPQTLKNFAQRFKAYGFNPEALTPVYGLAESTVALTVPPLNRGIKIDHVARQPFENAGQAIITNEKNALQFVSCGSVLKDHRIRIVNDKGEVLRERTVGELQFQGPSSMQGYYRNEAATRAILHEGWMDSGDLAYLAEDELYITGRKKDLIIKAGRNIYPTEIEELVGTINGIRAGSVVAFGVLKEAEATESLVIVAETHEQDDKKRDDIINHIQEALALSLDLTADQIILVKPHVVPKTSSGKLQRGACKKLYLENRLTRKIMPAWLQLTKLFMLQTVYKIKGAIFQGARLIYTLYVVFIFCVSFCPIYLIMLMGSSAFAIKSGRIWAHFLQKMLFLPLTISGNKAPLLKSPTPIIYVANHASYIDVFVMVAILPPGTRLIGKQELAKAPLLKAFMHKLRFLTVDRNDLPKGLTDTKSIEDAIRAGDSVLIFPEGTFGYAEGLRPFRMGAFVLSAKTNIPICPIAVHGTRKIFRDEEVLFRPGRIKVTVLDLVYPEGCEWKNVVELRNQVRGEIAKYCGEPSLDFISPQVVAPKLFSERKRK